MDTCWEMEDAVKDEDRESRLQLWQDAQKDECVADCNGQWKLLAQQTLERKNLCIEEFSLAVMKILVKGRGKGCNILIVGPASCAKTFLFKLLCTTFNAFVNPAESSIGLELEKQRLYI